MRNAKFFVAFLIAPIAFGLLMFLLSLFTAKPGEGAYVLLFIAYVGYPIALIIGLPLFALFRYLRWNGIATYVVSAIGFSILLSYLFIILPSFREGEPLANLLSPSRLAQMSLISFACILTVLTFWLVARPDKN